MNDETEDNDGDDNVSVSSAVQAKLGEKLKEVYSDVINEPVPDRFVELLNQLDKSKPGDSDQG